MSLLVLLVSSFTLSLSLLKLEVLFYLRHAEIHDAAKLVAEDDVIAQGR